MRHEPGLARALPAEDRDDGEVFRRRRHKRRELVNEVAARQRRRVVRSHGNALAETPLAEARIAEPGLQPGSGFSPKRVQSDFRGLELRAQRLHLCWEERVSGDHVERGAEVFGLLRRVSGEPGEGAPPHRGYSHRQGRKRSLPPVERHGRDPLFLQQLGKVLDGLFANLGSAADDPEIDLAVEVQARNRGLAA